MPADLSAEIASLLALASKSNIVWIVSGGSSCIPLNCVCLKIILTLRKKNNTKAFCHGYVQMLIGYCCL